MLRSALFSSHHDSAMLISSGTAMKAMKCMLTGANAASRSTTRSATWPIIAPFGLSSA